MGYSSLVLFSGGWDSAYCAMRAISQESRVPGLCFFNYDQPYLMQELRAVEDLQKLLGLPLNVIEIPKIRSCNGIFEDRNEVFISTALDKYRPQRVYIGVRNVLDILDKYKDSNLQWARRMEKKYKIKVVTPCVGLPKFWIKNRVGCLSNDVGKIIYSTEGL